MPVPVATGHRVLSVSLLVIGVILLGLTVFGFVMVDFGYRMSSAGAGLASPTQAASLDAEHTRHLLMLGALAIIALATCAAAIWRWPRASPNRP